MDNKLLFYYIFHFFTKFRDEKSDKQMAYVTFERDTAVKTALMLTNAVIGDSPITVRPADKSLDIDGGLSEQDGEIGQEEKVGSKNLFRSLLRISRDNGI